MSWRRLCCLFCRSTLALRQRRERNNRHRVEVSAVVFCRLRPFCGRVDKNARSTFRTIVSAKCFKCRCFKWQLCFVHSLSKRIIVFVGFCLRPIIFPHSFLLHHAALFSSASLCTSAPSNQPTNSELHTNTQTKCAPSPSCCCWAPRSVARTPPTLPRRLSRLQRTW